MSAMAISRQPSSRISLGAERTRVVVAARDALKPRKSKPVNGKPQTMATIPATTECHFTKPNTKSTTAQIEKKARGVGRFISPALCSTLYNFGDSNRKRLGVDECNGDVTTAIERRPEITTSQP